MANTVIQLRKSGTPNDVPTNLANGEIALNYADGKLYYKNVTGHIVSISGGGGGGGDNFGTVVANGTLLVADTTNDYLTINQGDNIIIVGDALTDTFTINANLISAYSHANAVGVSANAYADSLTPDLSPAFNKANDAYLIANTAFDKANAANLLAYGTGIGANAYSDSVGTAANNFAGTMANASNAYAASLTPDLSSVYIYANNVGSAGNANLSVGTVSANAFASSVGSSGNTYAEAIGTAGNTYASAVGTAANANLSVATIAANSYSDSVGTAANNFAGTMANATNAYAESIGTAGNANLSVATISANNWANTKLSNTSGVMFDGTLNIKTNLNIGNNITSVNSVIFNTAAGITSAAEGQITWNADESTFDLGMANDSILQVGQEIYYRVKNQTGSTIPEGTVVMAAGTLGASGRILVTPAISDGTYPSKYLMGIATNNILNGADGYVTHFGKVRGIDTSMWSEGDILYANVSVAGGLQNTMPTAPNTKTTVAIVVSKHAETGTLFVRPTYGSKLNEDELVELSSLTNGDVLVYSSSPGIFENKVQLALNAGSVNGYSANDIIDAANTYTRVFANSVGTAANANLSVATIAANSYADAVGTAANANLSVGTIAANSYSDSVGLSVNANLSVATASANNFAGTMANAANAYASATYFLKTGGTVSGDIVITGNATISGVTTYANTQTLLIGDNILTLNADIPNNVAPSENAGIEVNRGNKNSDAAIIWNETAGLWMFTSNTQVNYTKAIASNTDVDSAGAAGNTYTDTVVIANVNIANAYSRVFANSVGAAGNTYTDTVVIANLVSAKGYTNTYTDTVVVANLASAKGYTNTYTDTVVVANLDIANAYSRVFANSVGIAANTWANTKLSNGSITIAGTVKVTNALESLSTVTANGSISINRASGAGGSFLRLYNEVGDRYNITAGVGGNLSINTTYVGQANIKFYNSNMSTPGDSNTIYVGINTKDSPTYPLDVVGTINASSVLINGVTALIPTNTTYIGTTSIALNRASASQALTGITSIDGSAASVTNALTFASDGTGAAATTTYNGDTARTISYNSIGALPNTTGAIFAGDLNVTGNVIIDTNTFVLDKNAGEIGIGRTDPGYALDVVGTINAASILVNGSSVAPSASPTFTGTVTFNANVLSQTLTDAASIAWDVSLGQVATVTLGGNRALANASNLKVGTYILHVVQDGSGGRTMSFGTQYKFPGGVDPVLTTTANARDVLSFISDGTLMYGSFLPDVK